MSFDYNYKFWVATQKELEDILKRQDVFRELKPIQDPPLAHFLFAELYARYVQLVNKLGYIYHHTFQVQKRDVVKQLVESASERLLELKNELKNLELCEFIYIDKTLVKRRLTPDDIVVWTPKYFPYWRPYKIQEMISGPRKKTPEQELIEIAAAAAAATAGAAGASVVAGEGQAKQGDPVPIVTKEKVKPRRDFHEEEIIDPVKKKLKEVVTLIQSHERARVARVYLTNIRYNPVVYKPKMRDSGQMVNYKFTHGPGQAMLTPIKRTRFEANYFVSRKDLRNFNYYVKPVYQEVSQLLADDVSVVEESEIHDEELDEESIESDNVSSEGSEVSDTNVHMSSIYLSDNVKRLQNTSALKIQCFWRGFRDRKKYKALLEKKMLIYGMAQEFRPKSKRTEIYEERLREAERHRQIKEKHDAEFLRFCEDERARILRVRGPWIMEDISDNIRAWFQDFYKRLGCFHPYPEEVKGGTILLLRGETMTIFEYQRKLKKGKMTKDQKDKIKQKERELKKKLKDRLRKMKQEKEKRRAQMAKSGTIFMADEMERSKCIDAIENTMKKYKAEWADIDEKLNKKHEPIKEWITSDYYEEIHRELQLTVDELMRLEFELLQRALAKDKKRGYRAPRNKSKKGKKRGRKRGPKDMTANRSVESLYYELQDAGIVKEYPKKTFDYFIGERNNCAFNLLNIQLRDTPPFKGEIKDVLAEYVLGMGPLTITKPKAICLAGPTHSGKKLLCDILATEIDAVVLDISPENTVKYESDMKYFLHVIVKMAKLLQPTILYIKDVHRVFWKKVPEEFVDMNPKLLQPFIKKFILKFLKKEDKVFMLATTDAPWTGSGKMKSIFQKILLLPKTEYSTSFMLRRNVTIQMRSVPKDLDYSSLALVTREYASGDLVINVADTLNLRRRMELMHRPLNPMEFIDNFLDKDPPQFPPEPKEWEQFQKWYRRVSKLARKRAARMKMNEILREKKKPRK